MRRVTPNESLKLTPSGVRPQRRFNVSPHAPPPMRFNGTLQAWNDDRGFGLIAPAQGEQPLFVHIKAFPPGTGRPTVGLPLTFEVEVGPNGKKRARAVQCPARPRPRPASRVERPARWTVPRALLLPAFCALYAFVSWRWGFRLPILLGYLGLSLAAFVAYAMDKGAALAGTWRTRESTLHLFSLAGGWPGALVAQQVLRHKTSKRGFIAVFWTTVALNVAAFVTWHASALHAIWRPGAV